MLSLSRKSRKEWELLIDSFTNKISDDYKNQRPKKNPVIFFEKEMTTEIWQKEFDLDIETAHNFLKSHGFASKIEIYIIEMARENMMNRVRDRFIKKIQP